MKVVIYNQNEIKIISPIIDVDINIIADKDVPAGIPYIIVDSLSLPNEPQESWEVDFSNPNGIGLTPEQFEDKYPQYKGWVVK
jgi:hypothetical protein